MKKMVFGLLLLASSVSFANTSDKKVKNVSLENEKNIKTEIAVKKCSVELSSGSVLTLNCGTCSGSECLKRLTAILDAMTPH
jgi:hypothetical protein